MKPKHKGHGPMELLDSTDKRERCARCGDQKKRGEKWARKCPAGGKAAS